MSFDFTKGFVIYHDNDERKLFPTEWFYSSNYSNDTRSVYQAYDSNLFPLPDIKTWKSHAIKETCEKVTERLKDCDKEIYLDGYLLDRKTRTLSETQISE